MKLRIEVEQMRDQLSALIDSAIPLTNEQIIWNTAARMTLNWVLLEISEPPILHPEGR